MLCYVMLCYVMLCYVMLCYVMLCYVMLCYVMLCYVMLCYVMLCYVMLCYVMLCYVMLCYFTKLKLLLKIQGGTNVWWPSIFSFRNILSANKQILKGYWIRCLKNIVFKYLAPQKGVGRVFIFDFIVNVASDMWNLGFKGLLHTSTNHIFFYFLYFFFT